MAIKQYHFAVYVEINTETGEVRYVGIDPDAQAGSAFDESVYDVGTQEWSRPEADDEYEGTAYDVVQGLLNKI